MEKIENSEKVLSVFGYDIPEYIVGIIRDEYNRIISELAPARVVQILKRNNQPYIDSEAKEIIDGADIHLAGTVAQNNDGI